ncbi:MAG: hypothetical protein J6M02_01615 [Clostridia bacterium]|nr:hypothetical protein [Clostridia bacterium]
MKNKIIIVVISILTLALICIGIYIALTPVELPPEPVVEVDPYPENELANIEVLEIKRPYTKVPKRLAIRNYTDGLNADQINAIPKLSYKILTRDSKNYMLVVPYQINGTLTLRSLVWDSFLEEWVPNKEVAVFSEEITENYALLLQYERPEIAKYELQIQQGEDTVTYRISAPPAGTKLNPVEYFAADVKDETADVVYHEPEVSQQTTYTNDTTTDEAGNGSTTVSQS